MGAASYWAKVDRFLAQGSVKTESGWKLVGSELLASSAIQERVNKLTVVLTKARLIANVVEFTVERVTQVDLVPEGVAQLDTNKLAIPSPLYILFAVTVGVRVCLEGELSPDGVLS